jgi:uncharacterized protein YjbI with pentapeptide repeats
MRTTVSQVMNRSTYHESLARFTRITGSDARARPHVERRPRYDDDDPGPSLFRTVVESCALERLTLPGLFVARAKMTAVSFSGSDLHLSTMCWNDFTRCWFDQCDLTESDLRASHFVECDFRRADLTRCDLRQSTFQGCRFDGAIFTDALTTSDQRTSLRLSKEQESSISWQDAPGSVPPGG